MRILLAETNWNSMAIASGFAKAGLLVTRVNDAHELLDFAKFGEQSAIVFDLNMVGMKGTTVLTELRARHPRMPIYVLTESAQWDARKEAFRLGADDVFVGDRNVNAVAAQIMAGVRRASGFSSSEISFGALALNTVNNTASVDGNMMQLTRKEYEILELLTLKHGSLVTRETLMNHLYAWTDEPDSRIINVYLSRIRHQIEICGGDPALLETVWGLGYRMAGIERVRKVA
jgi:two-component system cell cycle response regulator CtrA